METVTLIVVILVLITSVFRLIEMVMLHRKIRALQDEISTLNCRIDLVATTLSTELDTRSPVSEPDPRQPNPGNKKASEATLIGSTVKLPDSEPSRDAKGGIIQGRSVNYDHSDDVAFIINDSNGSGF